MRGLFRTKSFLLNCIAQTLMTFAIGGLGYWVSAYLDIRHQPPAAGKSTFGVITVVAGLTSTILAACSQTSCGRVFRARTFWVSGLGMLIGCPLFVVSLYVPFPTAWIFMFLAIFFFFLNTGPSNTALANVSLPAVRATAFAINIFFIHALGDVPAF